MDDVEAEIARRMEPYREDVKRLCSIPGVEKVTAWGFWLKSAYIWTSSLQRHTWLPGRGYAQGTSKVPASA